MDFAEWACAVSQETNASLAGARVLVPQEAAAVAERSLLVAQMAEWGLVPVDARAEADLVFGEAPTHRELTGAEAVERAGKGMPVSAALAHELDESGALRGVRIACSLIVEPKTAVLLERLRAAGAEVGVYCHAHECDQRMADELRRRGFVVEADAHWTPAQEHEGALRLLDRLCPQVIIDDGANLGRLLPLERPDLLRELAGVSEETTSGVRAFAAMDRAGELPFPVVAVNDSPLKTNFDNRHGTGETCVTTIQALLGARCFDGAHVVVVGFGPVGEGFARRVRALGARITVVDVNPEAALRALYAGFDMRTLDEALPACDMLVSATGVRHTVTLDHLHRLPDGAVVTVIGGIANEVALDSAASAGSAFVPTTTRGISELAIPGGPRLRLLAEGDGVNYAAGPGNPIQIMDLSFAVQLAAVSYLLGHRDELAPAVHRLPEGTNRHLAALALATHGISASEQVDSAVPNWRLTRFADHVTAPEAGSSISPKSSEHA